MLDGRRLGMDEGLTEGKRLTVGLKEGSPDGLNDGLILGDSLG